MLRACEYQILQTVSAWLDLRGNDLIYVEGAEDFDIHSNERAEAVQVKTSPQPISLGQKEILKTLNNLWKLRQQTPGRAVVMRFLTLAPFTVEKGSPFGAGVAGLDLWQRRPLNDDEAFQLAKFLAKQAHLDPGFLIWLERANPSQIRRELVEIMTWQPQAEEAHFVERGIHNKLVTFAEKRGRAPASLIKQVAVRLKDEIWKILREPAPRQLDIFRIEELWEDVTRVSIPRSAQEALFNTIASQPPTQPNRPPDILRMGVPPLPGAVAQRTELVAQWRALLSNGGLLNLHGSTRMGKTTLAKLIASADSGEWRWWSAARKTPDEILRELSMLAMEVARLPDVADVVLDDLDFSPATAQGMDEALGDLLALVNGRRGRILITSQKPLPVRLQHALGISAGQIVAVPRLEEDEVAELAFALGCKDVRRCTDWSRLVWASTAGHPQLAAVRLLALREQEWPSITVESITSGVAAVDAEKADARELLDGLPQPQRELLHRLSVFPVAFRRDHAVAIGAAPPPVGSPGNAFNPLIGPWVEPLHADYFALSPLLADGARAALAPVDFKKLQNQAARVLLETKPVSTSEGAKAFLLLWQTRYGDALLGLAGSCVDMDKELFASLAEELWWFTMVAATPGQQLYSENPSISLNLRWFQFRVALSSAPERATSLVAAWRWELENGSHPEPTLLRFIFAGEILPLHQVPISGGMVIALLHDMEVAMMEYPDMPLPESLPLSEIDESGHFPELDDLVSALSFVSSQRCTNIGYLEEFLTVLDDEEPQFRERILLGFVGGGICVQMALDRAWLSESERQVPDWARCLKVFEQAFALGMKWECSPLAVAAMRGICVVLDEYIKDHQAAHKALDRMATSGGLAIHAIHDRRACIYFSEKNYSSAENEWRQALAEWPKKVASFDTGAAFAARSAGVSAARQERWEAAAEWFIQIVERLPTKNETAFMAGAYADAGFCLWKAGKPREMMSALIEAWRLAETLPLGREDLRAFTTRKTIGHVIAWLHGTATDFGVGELNEPIAGTCSSAETPEAMRELPETENAAIWLFLMRIERELEVGNLAATLGRDALAATRNPALRSLASVEKITQMVIAGDVRDLPSEIIAMTQAVHLSASLAPVHLAAPVIRVSPKDFEKTDSNRGASIFLAALVAAQARGSSWQDLLKDWRNSLPEDAGEGWRDWFDEIERVLGGSLVSANALVRNSAAGWASSMLGSWYVLLSTESSPDDVYFAHARWLLAVKNSSWLMLTANAFCHRVEITWGRVVLTPALLRCPSRTAPAIRVACMQDGGGLVKAACILLAASDAVSVCMSSEVRAAIRKMARV